MLLNQLKIELHMNSSANKKALVQERYASIAKSERDSTNSCCSDTACCPPNQSLMAEDYSTFEGYNPEADLALGCGLPVKFAEIKEGNLVVDLGSGAGNDCFVAASIVGNAGRVIGIDFTEAMIERAEQNKNKLKLSNVEFRLGDIESMPIVSNFADVVVSNCVLNLVPNKDIAFSEIFRVLKPGGHFCISDIVLAGDLPEPLKKAAEMYAGCVSGAIQLDDYLKIIEDCGFTNISIRKEKEIVLPEDTLRNYLSDEQMKLLRDSGAAIKSVTVYADKPAKDERNCCEPGNGCC